MNIGWCIPQIGKNRNTSGLNINQRRILVIISQILGDVFRNQLQRTITDVSIDKRGQVQCGVTIKSKLFSKLCTNQFFIRGLLRDIVQWNVRLSIIDIDVFFPIGQFDLGLFLKEFILQIIGINMFSQDHSGQLWL
ncbi:uncharacterized protein SPAPADRAFT_153358 [Spathaspora passalidarum NRRL Y-27907]|uniref:Uncharacterized protein n=1 Tax=Spathaspora passalidarum (strain NRRL Y-27907 / 11-Y1) TaxID=619300 RepID=G3AN23_SPAPN|nr:uncharacterized protein SPAPADRAFT_153358 [Spathaspora passalidarum NRRL Y-27907]EGW32434.1 hypothetical protein SPAPADRAFT_153358 [Spathaspora passalidarum NRRL Y-27907]